MTDAERAKEFVQRLSDDYFSSGRFRKDMIEVFGQESCPFIHLDLPNKETNHEEPIPPQVLDDRLDRRGIAVVAGHRQSK
jgi:hypothetical protein